jgi:ribosomal protein S8E
MKKRIKAQEEKNVKSAAPDEPSKTPLPQYLLDRSQETNAKALSSAIKNKRNEKAAKFAVPLPKVKGISEEEMFKVINTGKKTHKKAWKRMITKPTFVGNDFTRRPVKYERFIRPMGLRYKKCNVTQYVLSPGRMPALRFILVGYGILTVCSVPSWLSLCNSLSCPSRRTPRTLSIPSWVS